jgi:hypothetical protein
VVAGVCTGRGVVNGGVSGGGGGGGGGGGAAAPPPPPGTLVAARGAALEVWRAVPLATQVRDLLKAKRREEATALAETAGPAPVATLDDEDEDEDDAKKPSLADVAHAEAGFAAMSDLDFAAAAGHFAASRTLHPSEVLAYFPRHLPAGRELRRRRRRRYWGLPTAPVDIDSLVSSALRARGDGGAVDLAAVRECVLEAKRALVGYLSQARNETQTTRKNTSSGYTLTHSDDEVQRAAVGLCTLNQVDP